MSPAVCLSSSSGGLVQPAQVGWCSLCTGTRSLDSQQLQALTPPPCCCCSHTHIYIDDLYDVLSVPATASLAEIKAAYRRLVHDLHPDKHAHKHTRQVRAPVCLSVRAQHSEHSEQGCRACHQLQALAPAHLCACVGVALQSAAMADAFLQCKLAYEVLSDPQQRRSYDEGRAAAGGQQVGCEGVVCDIADSCLAACCVHLWPAAVAASSQSVTAPHLRCAACRVVQQGPTASSSQPWSPYYNGWMDAYGTTANNPADSSSSGRQGTWGSGQGGAAAAATDYYQAMQQAAAATAAAGACHSGLSDFADPLAAALGSSGDDDSMVGTTSREQQQTSAAVRAALLQEHGLALEQFGSLQDAVAALSERDQQQTLVGLAEGDYDNTWTL